MSAELPNDIHDRVTDLSERGNALLDENDAQGAVALWQQALALLPEPKAIWDAATWLYASIGDAERQSGNLEAALAAFRAAMASGDGQSNPFVQISLGATLLDLGYIDEATDSLLRAYMLEGKEIFNEFGGPYFQFLREKGLVD